MAESVDSPTLIKLRGGPFDGFVGEDDFNARRFEICDYSLNLRGHYIRTEEIEDGRTICQYEQLPNACDLVPVLDQSGQE